MEYSIVSATLGLPEC